MPRYKVIAIELWKKESFYYVEAKDEEGALKQVEYGEVEPHTSRHLDLDETLSTTVEEIP